VKPGCTVRDLVEHRIKRGSFFCTDPKQYISDLRSMIAQRTDPTTTIMELKDGRVIKVVNQPMPSGGWVVTHDDITERRNLLRARRQAEELLREQKLQLDTALRALSV
jgi:PAS domain-containing protein